MPQIFEGGRKADVIASSSVLVVRLVRVDTCQSNGEVLVHLFVGCVRNFEKDITPVDLVTSTT